MNPVDQDNPFKAKMRPKDGPESDTKDQEVQAYIVTPSDKPAGPDQTLGSSESHFGNPPSPALTAVEGYKFNFDDQDFRFFYDEEDRGWFCATDICHYFGYENVRDKIKEYGVLNTGKIFNFSGQRLLFVPEESFLEILEKSKTNQAGKLLVYLSSVKSIPCQKVEHAVEQVAPPQPENPPTETESPFKKAKQPSVSETKLAEEELQEEDSNLSAIGGDNPSSEEVKELRDEFVAEIDAQEIHRKFGRKQPFNEWIKKMIEDFDFKEGKDFIKNENTGQYLLSQGMASKLVDTLSSQLLAEANAVRDRSVHTIIIEGNPFRYLFDNDHNKWFCVSDVGQYLGEDEIQGAIDNLAPEYRPVTLSTDEADYICFSENALAHILLNSKHKNARDIYQALLGRGMPEKEESMEESAASEASPSTEEVSEEKTEKASQGAQEQENSQPYVEEIFVLTPEPRPSDQTSLDIRENDQASAEGSSNPQLEPEPEPETSQQVFIDEAIGPELKPLGDISAWMVDAQGLHAYLRPPLPYPAWIEELIDLYGYLPGTDFTFNEGKFFLTCPMAREVSMTVPTLQGREARQYLASYGDGLISPIEEPSQESRRPVSEPSSEESFSTSLDSGDELIEEEREVEEPVPLEGIEGEAIVEVTSEETRPADKDKISPKEEALHPLSIVEAAKYLGTGSQFLYRFLEDIGWYMPESHEPAMAYIKKGYMAYDFSNADETGTEGKITEAGIKVLQGMLENLGLIPVSEK